MNFFLSWSVCPWQAFPAYSNKLSSLIQKFVNYGQKSFITLGPCGSDGIQTPQPYDFELIV
jgi:hypothetical protein